MIKFPGWRAQNNEGPPDLDQVMRDVSRKINALFGGSGNNRPNNQPSSSNNSGISLPILPILGIIALIWLATGFYIVDQGSLGVVQRFGKYLETTEPGPRWHLPYPMERVDVVNMEQVRRLEVGYRSSGESGSKVKQPKEALMLTEDE
ncbi:MAG: protease modulator HflK, partial [Betaproteobacteria bacterium HGW-Betaproteobacteria-20]